LTTRLCCKICGTAEALTVIELSTAGSSAASFGDADAYDKLGYVIDVEQLAYG
jgi:hypothetical protein